MSLASRTFGFGAAQQLSVSLSTWSVSGAGPNGKTVTTNSVTATVSGGTPPYTYLWQTSGESFPTSSTSATTAFSANGVNTVIDDEGTITVTDSAMNTAQKTVSISIFIGTPP